MLEKIRRHIVGNMVGYLALLIATSGTAYAASITGADIVNDTVTGADVKESTLAQVPKSLLSGKRVKYQISRSSTGDYNAVKIVDFRGLELRVNCADTFPFATVEARSTLTGAKLDYSVIEGDISAPNGAAGSAIEGGQDMQQGTWIPLRAQATNSRGLYHLLLSHPTRLVTADFVVRMVSAGGYTCSVDGVLGGV